MKHAAGTAAFIHQILAELMYPRALLLQLPHDHQHEEKTEPFTMLCHYVRYTMSCACNASAETASKCSHDATTKMHRGLCLPRLLVSQDIDRHSVLP